MQALAASIQKPFRRMRPPQIVVLVFLALVLTGSAVLCLPVCAKSGEPTSFLTALFTATSATCVTGLIQVDTGTYWSTFGQVVIILLIQLGGLGFMTVSTIF
ncbi:MAG TPA: Trk family potassium uptake protein, partial [Clostridiales bacterium]|nr:Trk family potassium uptake protein [Clostridiales bacterium]